MSTSRTLEFLLEPIVNTVNMESVLALQRFNLSTCFQYIQTNWTVQYWFCFSHFFSFACTLTNTCCRFLLSSLDRLFLFFSFFKLVGRNWIYYLSYLVWTWQWISIFIHFFLFFKKVFLTVNVAVRVKLIKIIFMMICNIVKLLVLWILNKKGSILRLSKTDINIVLSWIYLLSIYCYIDTTTWRTHHIVNLLAKIV